MKTAIVGLGVTGYSCLRHLYGSDDLVVIDTRRDPPFLAPAQQHYADADYITGIRHFDFTAIDRVVVSPGVSLTACLLAPAVGRGIPLVSDIDLFFAATSQPVYGITGTNGKSTVTSMLGHIKTRLGQRTGVGGNLGDAALDILDPDAQCYVLELSSFQLERMADHRFAAASILNITEDHLDRHGDMAEYQQTKHRVYADAELVVFNRADARTRPLGQVRSVSFGPGQPQHQADWGVLERRAERLLVCGDQPVATAADLSVQGLHNEQNVLAAFALSGEDPQVLESALRGYRGLAHRCELIAEHHGVRYINDSKATNPGATLAALAGLGGPHPDIYLIAGGDGKGASFEPLRSACSAFVVRAYLIGQDAGLLEATIAADTSVVQCASLAEALMCARADAQPGTTVLLSPACASLDMYTSYRARGDQFRDLVEALP